jgi:hypothetical protein
MSRSTWLAGGLVVAGGVLAAYFLWGRDTEQSTRRSEVVSRPPDGVNNVSPTAINNSLDSPVLSEPRELDKPTGDPTSLDPRSPAYTAAMAFKATGANMQEIYVDEPRIEPWASDRERAIVAHAEADVLALDPKAKLEADCRASSCRVRIYSGSKFLTEEMGNYPFACLGRFSTADLGLVDPDDPDRTYADVYVLFGEQNRDPSPFAANRDLTCPNYAADWRQRVANPYESYSP